MRKRSNEGNILRKIDDFAFRKLNFCSSNYAFRIELWIQKQSKKYNDNFLVKGQIALVVGPSFFLMTIFHQNRDWCWIRNVMNAGHISKNENCS